VTLTLTPEELGSVALLRGLALDALRDLVPMFASRTIREGEIVFSEGDPGGSMLLLTSGRVEVTQRVPGNLRRTLAHVGAGEPIGELALLSGAPRSATVRALEPTTAWELDATAFEVLRRDGRPVAIELMRRIGETALQRLRRQYARIAEALDDATGLGSARLAPIARPEFEQVAPEPDEVAYLSGVVLFRDLAPVTVAEATAGGMRIAVPRGANMLSEGMRAEALLIVIRGALESTIRRGDRMQRVRLAGPGRAAAHLGVLDDGPSPVDIRAREHSVVLVLPRDRVLELVHSADRPHRTLTSRIHMDVARALNDAQRPHGMMASALVRNDAAAA